MMMPQGSPPEPGTRVRVPILYYHRVDKNIAASKGISPEHFAAQMEYLRRKNYQSVTLDDLAAYFLSGHPLPARPLILTFDDGYLDNFTYAYPILKRFGFTATFFLVSAYIGQRSEWEGCTEEDVVPLMSRENIHALMVEGFHFGGHTRTHPKLVDLAEEEARSEIVKGKEELENLLQRSVRSFAYPFGDFDERVMAFVQEAGFVAARTVHTDNTHTREDLLKLRCVKINEQTPPHKFKLYLTRLYHWETTWHERRRERRA